MAYIYIDNFETVLTGEMDDLETSLRVSAADAARIEAAFGFGPNVPRALAGPKFVRLPLLISDSAQREVVFATFADAWGVSVKRTAGLTFLAGAAVRCVPLGEIVAAGHMMYRVGAADEVDAAPGERALLDASGSTITLNVPSSFNAPQFVGEDWPAEVVILNKKVERTVRLEGYYGGVQFSVAGELASQSSLTLPATCNVAVITIRRVPWPLRVSGGVGTWMVAVEHYA